MYVLHVFNDTPAMDAMSDAVDKAEVVLYGVSLAYKESANCRLEANYAHQQEKDMIPLMMQKQYNVKGCKFILNHLQEHSPCRFCFVSTIMIIINHTIAAT